MRSTTGELRDETIWIESNGAAKRIQYTFCVISSDARSLSVRCNEEAILKAAPKHDDNAKT
jgi:hypothetical protein